MGVSLRASKAAGSCRRLMLSYIALLVFAASLSYFTVLAQTLELSPCRRNADCPYGSFCSSSHPFSTLPGSCARCWRCCLLPDLYVAASACSASCQCNEGAQCRSAQDCSAGLFCAVTDPLEPATCQKCTQCTDDSMAVGGSCAASCPSGVVPAALPARERLERVFLSFVAAELTGSGSSASPAGPLPPSVTAAQVAAWLSEVEGLRPPQLAHAVSAITSNRTETGVEEWRSLLMTEPTEELLCPELSELPATTYVGCPCNATDAPAAFGCPAGSRCSPAAYRGLSTDLVASPAATLLRAVCVACSPGQHCPPSTYVDERQHDELGSLDCPQGHYCPEPDSKLPCPPGYFCPEGTSDPRSCDYEALLRSDPYALLPVAPLSVVERLRNNRDPVRGNFCPSGAVKPNVPCKGGYYCPNATAQILCPRGHYCSAQSVAPRRCRPLSRCPPGTAEPAFSGLAFLIPGVVVALLPLIWLLIRRLDVASSGSGGDGRGGNGSGGAASGGRRNHHHRGGAGGCQQDERTRAELRRARARRSTQDMLDNLAFTSIDPDAAGFQRRRAAFKGFRLVKPPIHLVFSDVGLHLHDASQQVVLDGVTGSFAPSKLNAVMGPSGCGKSTFINVLCGRGSGYGSVTGSVTVNGERIPLPSLKKILGFVPQEDLVHDELTVRENLSYAAALKLPPDMPPSRRAAIVDDVLDVLMLRPVQDYVVGCIEARGISGGQRKRVNLGLELVGMPSLLFLDEPTSGLDATSGYDIMMALSDMAALGMTVVAVVHQPRFASFLLFDQVLMLGATGRPVYMGPPVLAPYYFRHLQFAFPLNENPADVIMDVIAGRVARQGDPVFQPAKLAQWWEKRGRLWVDQFADINPQLLRRGSAVEPALLQAIAEEFDELDATGSGRLNAQELLELFQRLGLPRTIKDAEDVVRKLDNDGDGLVTKEELLAAYTGFGQAARHEAIAAAQQLIHGGVDEAAAAAGVSFPDLDMSRLTGTRTSSRPTGELELVIRRISADLGLSAQVTRRLTAETALRSRRLTGGRTTTRQEPQQEVGGAAAGGQAGQLSQAEEEALEALQYVPASWVEDEVARGLNMFRYEPDSLVRSSKASEGGLSSSGGSIASGLWRAVSMSGGDGAVSVTARSSSAGGGTPTPGEERQQQGASEPGEQTEPLALAAEVSRAGSALLRADSTRRKSRSVRFTEESQSSGGGAASSAFDQQQQQQQQVNLDNMRWHNIWAGSSVAGDVGGAVTAAAAQANGAAHGAALPPSRGPRSGPALIGRLEPQSSDPSEPLSELSDEGGAEELLAVQPGEVSFHLIANGSGGSNVTAGRSSSLSPRHACRAPQTADVTADEVLSAGDSTPTGGGRPTLEFRLSNFFLSTSKNAAADDAANGRVQLPPAAVAAAHANSSRDGRPARESNGSSIEDGRGSGFVSQRVTREQTESVADEEHAFIAGYRSRSRSSDAVGSTISSEHTARSGSTGAGTEHTDSQSGSAYTWYSSEGARGPQQQQGQRPALPLLDGVGRTDSGTCDTSGAYNAFTYRHGRPLSQSVLSAGSAGGGVTTSQAPRQQTPAAGTVLFGSSQDENAAHASEGVAAASSEEPQDIVTQIFSGLNHSFVATATAGGSNAAAGSGLDATRVADAAYGRDNRASSIFDLTRRQQLTTSERYAQLASKRLLFKELASRRLPSLVSQLATLVKRGLLQAARSFWPVRVVDTLLLLAAGLVVGGIQGTHWTVDDVPGNAAMAMVVLAVLATATHMRTFSTGGHMFRRESAAGVRTLAYFGSHALVDMMWVALSPALFLAPYYYLTLPRAAFAHHYAVALGVCFWASGAAYLCSVVAPRQTAFAAGVFVVLVAGAFINGLSPSVASARGGVLEYVLGLSFNRWAMELLSIYELVEHQDTMRNSVLMVAKSVGLCGVDQRLYDDNDEALSAREAVSFLRTQDSFAGDHCARYRTYGYAALFLTGLLTRLATLAALELTGWRTQRRAAAGTGAAKG